MRKARNKQTNLYITPDLEKTEVKLFSDEEKLKIEQNAHLKDAYLWEKVEGETQPVGVGESALDILAEKEALEAEKVQLQNEKLNAQLAQKSKGKPAQRSK